MTFLFRFEYLISALRGYRDFQETGPRPLPLRPKSDSVSTLGESKLIFCTLTCWVKKGKSQKNDDDNVHVVHVVFEQKPANV